MMRQRFVVLGFVVMLAGTRVQAVTQADIDQAIGQLTADSQLISQWSTDQMTRAVPFNMTAGNVIPRQLKIFGVEFGISGVVSGTKLDVDALRKLGTTIIDTTRIDTFSRLPMPLILGHAKVGLPWGFDAGFRFGGIPSTSIDQEDTQGHVENTVWGLDLRKAVIKEDTGKPGLTVGVNFTRAIGSIDVTSTYNSNLGTTVQGSQNYSTTLSGTGTGRNDWDTKSVGFQAILNKKMLFFNPYIGASANKNFGEVQSAVTTAGNLALTNVNNAADTATTAVNTRAESRKTPNDWNIRALLGAEFNLLPFMTIGLQGEYAGSQNIAGGLGLRFQFR